MSLGYIAAVMVIVFAVDFALRALPFAALEPLRESDIVQALARWMPAGVLAILAVATFVGAAWPGQGVSLAEVDSATSWRWVPAVVASVATIAIHLVLGRRTLWSVGGGTVTFMLLLPFFS